MTPAKMVSSISKQTILLVVSRAIVMPVALNVMTSRVTSLMDAVTARETFEVIELRHKSCTLSGIWAFLIIVEYLFTAPMWRLRFSIGLRCETCDFGFFNLSRDNPDGCQSCGCSPFGSIDPYCDTETGQCLCQERVEGLQCDRCMQGYHGFDAGCVPCDCDADGIRCCQSLITHLRLNFVD